MSKRESQCELSGVERGMEKLGRWVLGHRAFVVVAVLAATAGLGSGIAKLTVNNANELWFATDDETLLRYDEFKQTFGSDEFVFLLLRSDDVFTAAGLRALDETTAMLESIEYDGQRAVTDVIHIGNVGYVRGGDDMIEVVELTDGLARDAAGLAQMRERAFETPAYEGLLVNRAGTAAGIVARVRSMIDDDEFNPFLQAALLAGVGGLKNYDLTVAGGPILDADMDRATISESLTFGALALLLNALVMGLLFRRAAGVAIPMVVVVTTLIWTFGLMGHLGVAINIAHVILPVMLIAVAISDAIHILSEYQTERRAGLASRDAIIRTIGQVGMACLLTTATTAAGMASLAVAPIPPIRTLGLFAAAGVFAAYIITMLLVPVLLDVAGLEPRAIRTGANTDWSTRVLTSLADFTVRFAKPIVAVSALLIVISAIGASRIIIETDFVAAFKESFPTRQAFNTIDSTLGGTTSLQMVFDTGREGGVKDPQFLRQLSDFQTWLDTASPKVVSSLSVANLVENMNQVLEGGDAREYRIPNERAAVAQQLLLYENSDPDALFEMVTDDYRVARLDIRARSGGTRVATQLMDDATARAGLTFPAEVTARFTGVSHLFVMMTENLSRGQIRSYLAAFVMILLMMMAMLRSARLGLWSMVPNLLPILVTLGVMGFFDIRLDFITLLIACVAIGIAVDDTIHFLVRFRKVLDATGDYAEAIRRSLTSVGRAMLFTTLVLCTGFLMFIPSVMQSVANFGALVALTVGLALVADLLLMPAMLVVFRPARVRRVEPVPVADPGPAVAGDPPLRARSA